jgi:hypothetical protein
MQIAATSATTAYTAADRQTTPSPIETAVAQLQAQQKAAAAKPFEPAPEIRPNVQDYVDINRTLLMLRKSGG